MPWRASANSAEGYIACALSGLGLIQIPAYDVAHHLAAGELVEVMPEHKAEAMEMSLLFIGQSASLRRLAIFAAWLEDLMGRRITGRRGATLSVVSDRSS